MIYANTSFEDNEFTGIDFTFLSTSLGVAGKVRLLDEHKKIRYFSEEYPPANFIVDDKLVGIAPEILDFLFQDLGLPQKNIDIVPWVRGYHSILNQPKTALFVMSRTPERDKIFKWVGPVFSSTLVMVAKSNSGIDINNQSELFNYSSAALRGDITEKLLLDMGYPVSKIALTRSLAKSLTLLKNNRVDLAIMSIHGLHHELEKSQESVNQYEIVWHVTRFGNYFAFSHDVSEDYINALQSSLEKLEPNRIKTLQKYDLPKVEY